MPKRNMKKKTVNSCKKPKMVPKDFNKMTPYDKMAYVRMFKRARVGVESR